MSKVVTFVLVLLTLLLTSSFGQVGGLLPSVGGPCPTSNSTLQTISFFSPKLICVMPQVYGPGGLVGIENNGPLGTTDQSSASFKHSVHFQNGALGAIASLARPLTVNIGTQLSQLPIASPTSGFIFSFNPAIGVELEAARNFGPIMSERAQTIGRHKLFLGFSYQYFNFDEVDGVSLRNLGAVFHHEFEICPNLPTVTCYNDNGVSVPTITKDFISTQNRIDLKVNQFIAIGTFGVTNRLDLSLAIPILEVSTDMTSDATFQNIENTDPTILPQCCVHLFNSVPLPGETLFPPITAPSNGFSYNNHALFQRSGSVVGLGDIVLRGKFQILQTDKSAIALGVDTRVPTGDELNFLGSGTWGVKPFVAFSYAGRVSPHANFGIQINGNSILAGDITANIEAKLPDVINYSAGVDFGLSKRLGLSMDFLGLVLTNQHKIIEAVPVEDFAGGLHPSIGNILITLNEASMSLGGKVNPFGGLLITANVLFRLNDAGLRYKPVPMVALAYSF